MSEKPYIWLVWKWDEEKNKKIKVSFCREVFGPGLAGTLTKEETIAAILRGDFDNKCDACGEQLVASLVLPLIKAGIIIIVEDATGEVELEPYVKEFATWKDFQHHIDISLPREHSSINKVMIAFMATPEHIVNRELGGQNPPNAFTIEYTQDVLKKEGEKSWQR